MDWLTRLFGNAPAPTTPVSDINGQAIQTVVGTVNNTAQTFPTASSNGMLNIPIFGNIRAFLNPLTAGLPNKPQTFRQKRQQTINRGGSR